MVYLKVAKGVNPESSHHKGKNHFFVVGGELYDVMDVD